MLSTIVSLLQATYKTFDRYLSRSIYRHLLTIFAPETWSMLCVSGLEMSFLLIFLTDFLVESLLFSSLEVKAGLVLNQLNWHGSIMTLLLPIHVIGHLTGVKRLLILLQVDSENVVFLSQVPDIGVGIWQTMYYFGMRTKKYQNKCKPDLSFLEILFCSIQFTLEIPDLFVQPLICPLQLNHSIC